MGRLLLLMFVLIFVLIGGHNAGADEGFYFLNDYPSYVTHTFASRNLRNAFLATGAFSKIVSKELTFSETKEWFWQRCQDSRVRLWFREACEQAKTCIKSSSAVCRIEYYGNCSGAAVNVQGKVFFASARHCYDPNKKPIARFLSLDMSEVVAVDLKIIPASSHKLPYDISLFEMPTWPTLGRPPVQISSRIRENDKVFSSGFAFMGLRTQKNADYPAAYNDIRVTFGRVLNPNLEKKAYCHFSNNIFDAYPSFWKLEEICPESAEHTYAAGSKGALSYGARVERNVLLTDTDMINGMSGSPLFSSSGKLVGIGTTVLKDKAPLNYSVKAQAVYVKAENIFQILQLMQQR